MAGIGKGKLLKPLQPIAEEAFDAVGSMGMRLARTVAPDWIPTPKPGIKFKMKRNPALDFTIDLSDHTANNLYKHAKTSPDAAKSVRTALEEGSIGNTEPLNKYSDLLDLSVENRIPPKQSTRPLRRDYPPTQEGRQMARDDFQKWLDPEVSKVGGDMKKVKRGSYAPEGVFFGEKKQGIKGLTEYAQGGEQPNFYNVGPLEERAWQINPENHPQIKQFFDDGHAKWEETAGRPPEEGGQIGVDPRLTFEDFKKYVTRTSAAMDNATAKFRRLWEAKTPTKGPMGQKGGIKIGGRQADIPRAYDPAKEHMKSVANKASNVGESQVIGNQFYNQMMGKLDSFSERIMGDILNLPGGGGRRLMSGKEIQNPNVQLKVDQAAQQGWMKAVTDWTGARSFDKEGKLVIDENFLGTRLDDSDKIRIQQAQFTHASVNKKGPFRTDITGQEQVAMKVLAEKQITDAYLEAGLGTGPDEEKILWELLMEIGNTMQVNRAKAISPEGQLKQLALDNPGKTLDELKELVKEVEGATVQTSKTGFKKQKFGTIKSKEGVVTKLGPEKPLSDSEFLARVAPGKKKEEEKSIRQYVKSKVKEAKKKPEIVYNPRTDQYPSGEYQGELELDQLDQL
tara:strand:+ start:138 stop:2006 length:1869 start_codon:yes stop_codon:yes gene_type:complete